MKKLNVLIAHPSTQHSYQIAKQLEKEGILFEFWTSLVILKHSRIFNFLKAVLPDKLFLMLSNRIIEGIEPSRLKILPIPELQFLLKKSCKDEAAIYHRNKSFQEAIPESSIQTADIIIGFDTSSWILAKRAKANHKIFILDQSIAHPLLKEEIYQRLNVLFPLWSEHLHPKSAKLIALEKDEHQLADYIVAASHFTKDSLINNGVESKKILVNSYGVDAIKFKMKKKRDDSITRFLFLGTLNARKGLPLLLKVWEELKLTNAELWLIGPYDHSILKNFPKSDSIHLIGKIPHENINTYLNECDVLIFPSYFEGFGLVILEAMACGLPVITTYSTAGPDIIEHGINGLLYDAFDKSGLKNNLLSLVNNNDYLEEMSTKARKKAEVLSWDVYRENWKQILNNC